jgi:hypothetical protein
MYATKQYECTVVEMLSYIQFLPEIMRDGMGYITSLFLICCFIVLGSSIAYEHILFLSFKFSNDMLLYQHEPFNKLSFSQTAEYEYS